MICVVDASVAVKWFVEEPGTPEALDVLGSGDVLAAPELILAEIGNTIWKKLLRGEISREHADAIVRGVPFMFDHIRSTAAHLPRALEIASAIEHPLYDCLYLSVAESESSVLVTDDGKLAEAVSDTSWQKWVRPLR